MDRKKLLKPLLFLMFFILTAEFFAGKFFWYSSIWYFDMLMHFSGGLWEGLLFMWFFSIGDMPFVRISLDTVDFKLIFKTVLFVLVIGILWEVFEFYVYTHIGGEIFNTLDTMSDIFFDLAGGTFVFLYCFKRVMPIKQIAV